MFLQKLADKDYQEFLNPLGYKMKHNGVRLIEGDENSFALVSCEENQLVKELGETLLRACNLSTKFGRYDISDCIIFHDFYCHEFGEDGKEYNQEWYEFMSKKFPNYEEEYEKFYQKMENEKNDEREH